VVENVAGQFLLAPGATQAPMLYFETSVNWFSIPAALGQPNSGIPTAGLSQHVQFVNDISDFPPAIVAEGNYLNSTQFITMSGYLENCAVTGCPAIAH